MKSIHPLRNRLMRIVFIFIAAAMIVATPLSAVNAQGGGPVRGFNPICTVRANRLNLRSGPGVNYPIIGKLVPGTLVNVIGRTRDVTWIQIVVRQDGRTGWVNSETEYIACLGLMGAQPVVAPPPPPTRQAPRPQQAARPAPAPAASTPPLSGIPAPNAIGYDGSGFTWEWGGLAMMPDPNWYFDIKIYANKNEPFPYAVKIPSLDELEHSGPNRWRYVKSTDFLCGSEWSVQIARRNPDGSFAGFASPESQRLPTGQGCGESLPGSAPDAPNDGGGGNDPGPGECPYC